MPLHYDIDESARFVRFVAEAIPSRSEWKESFDAAFGDPRFRRGFGVLYDRRGVAEIPNPARLRQWMTRYARTFREYGTGRIAVVVDERVVFGMFRVAGVYAESEGVELGVFWSEAEAVTWLRG